ncbi:MAG TPA: hypothetical protein VFK65_02935 [Candidatus Binatia bacterium]|nr:hypothetical protein [Candidatus Binatia bacterium]
MECLQTIYPLILLRSLGVFLLLGLSNPAWPSHHYTAKQMEALASRVGQTYWSQPVDGKGPSFATAPTSKAQVARLDAVESFQITALVGQAAKNPYYKIKRENGQEGYISPEQFLEALNLTIVTTDPLAEDKRKVAEAAEVDKKRVEWIRAQPWSPAIKEAAIKKQPIPGLNTNEIKNVLGPPSRVTKVRGPIKVAEEHWLYPDGTLLIFQNSLLIRVERKESK